MKFTFPPESRPLEGYTLKRGIARGGFGEVYYGLSDAGKEVAIKLLQQNMDVELRGVQHCLNLRHPHLVAIYDVKTDSEHDHWVIMEYIGGDTLEQILLKQRGPLPLDQIERLLAGVESGLAYLHDRGIVHRDVKPGNIFWDDGAIKIGDVGLSKFMTPSRRSAHTESVGTVYYMAPEVAYGKYGYEVDIYSCGIMLYEMLTGKLPFDGQSTAEILMKHLSEPPDLSIVPVPFQRVVEGALRKDPKARTPTITQLFHDFQNARQGLPPQLVPPFPRFGQPTQFAEPVPRSVLPAAPVAPVVQAHGDPSLNSQPVNAAMAARFPFGLPPAGAPPLPNFPSPRAGQDLAQQDMPSLDWWLPRIAALIGLMWIFGSWSGVWGRSMFATLMTVWPITLLCLRFGSVQGSGLAWLWKELPLGQGDAAFSTSWWTRRLMILGGSSLTVLAMLSGPMELRERAVPFTMLYTILMALHLLRPSALERQGISLRSGNAPKNAHWELRDWADWFAFRRQQIDQTSVGFWRQRLAFYAWAQVMLLCCAAGVEHIPAADDCFFAVIVMFPFTVVSWILIGRGKDGTSRKSWASGTRGTTTSPVTRQPSRTADSHLNRTVDPHGATYVPPQTPSKPRPSPSVLSLTPDSVRHLSARQRMADLTVSMTWAMFLTLLFAIGTGFLSPLFVLPSSLHPDAAKLGMFTITTLVAAWALLAVGKLTEGRSTSGRPRRLLNLLVGVAVGSVGWWLGQVLIVDLPVNALPHNTMFLSLGRQPLVIENRPTQLAFMVFFGLLFGIRRWWWHTDAYRPVVFRITSVIMTVTVAALLPLVFSFPWDWAVTWAAVISCVVQLSAVWTPPERRTA